MNPNDTLPTQPVDVTAPVLARFTRQAVLRALHSLEHPGLSAQENANLYGVCFREHGHHYKVNVSIEAEIDPQTGLCRFRRELDAVIERELVARFDGRSLNASFTNTSGEALAHVFHDLLRPHIPEGIALFVGVQETRKNLFERL